MSRCFPYPSPAYAGKCASNQALICTIKLQRDCDKRESEKKDRRKEKKEKRRKDKSNGTVSKEKALPTEEKLYIAGKSDNAEACSKKLQDSTNDNMERSNLTEEHGKPCCSSDSTENSGKRKRQSSPQASNNTRSSGNVIRIVLSSQKKEDRLTPSSSNNTTLSSPAVKLNSLSKKKPDVEVKPASILRTNRNLAPLSKKADVETKHLSNLRIAPKNNAAAQQLTTINSNKVKLAPLSKKADVEVKPLSSNLRITPPKCSATQNLSISNSIKEKTPHPDKKVDQGSTSKAEKKLPRPLRKYQALFENWAPLPMEVDTVDDEEDWLFGSSSKKEECQTTAKRMKYCKEEVLPYCGSASIQPQALLLSDVDLYALPFTVPF